MKDELLMNKLGEAMIRELDYKRQISIMKEALHYYASANCYKAKLALQKLNVKPDHLRVDPPIDQL